MIVYFLFYTILNTVQLFPYNLQPNPAMLVTADNCPPRTPVNNMPSFVRPGGIIDNIPLSEALEIQARQREQQGSDSRPQEAETSTISKIYVFNYMYMIDVALGKEF